MANNSAKKNEEQLKKVDNWLKWVVGFLLIYFFLFSTASLISESISLVHYMLCLFISALTYICYRQILKCWSLQLPSEAFEYYIDLLVLNSIVHLVHPWWYGIWHIYWTILVFLLSKVAQWLWGKLETKYEAQEEGE